MRATHAYLISHAHGDRVEAHEVARRHGLRSPVLEVEDREKYFRLTVRPTKRFRRGTFEHKRLAAGVYQVLGELKEKR
jgi:hypothetical protein